MFKDQNILGISVPEKLLLCQSAFLLYWQKAKKWIRISLVIKESHLDMVLFPPVFGTNPNAQGWHEYMKK